MTTQQTACPCFPLTSPYQATVPTPSFVTSSIYPAAVVPSAVGPNYDDTVLNTPRQKESRKFYLDRSLFDLVDTHPYLALTDPNLLGWYLRLSPEDRKIIQDEGGFQQFLQRHPALELSSHHVYVKYPALPPFRPNKPTSGMSGGKKCNCGIHHDRIAVEMLPKNVREALILLGCNDSRDALQKHPHEDVCLTDQLGCLQEDFQTAFSSPITQDPTQRAHSVKLFPLKEERPSWQMDNNSSTASLSVDLKLDTFRQVGKPELRSHNPVTQGQSANSTYVQVSPSQSDWPTVERTSPSVDTAADDASFSLEAQSDSLYSIMEDDRSILACLPSEDEKAHNSSVPGPGPVTPKSVTFKSDQPVMKMNTTERSTSPPPCVPTCDVLTGTEPPLYMSASIQTEGPGTTDKHVLTDLHMADLDYLAEKFMKLKLVKEEQSEQQEKMRSLACKVRKECERAQQAELSLLALQYSLSRQSLYCSSEGGQFTPLPKKAPENVLSLLQQLECEYNKMRHQILAGVPLEQLKPLSVDSDTITPGASYIPEQVTLGYAPSCSEEPHNASGEEDRSPDSESSKRQNSPGKEIKTKNKVRRAVTSIPLDRDVTHNAKQEENQKSACKEISTSEAWYDAEEDLEPSGPAEATEAGQNPLLMRKDTTTEPSSEEAQSSILCVSNLPNDVTERDVKLWFDKYHVSDVSISASRNGLKVAIVTISGVQSAKAAVRELHHCNMQGSTLHVEHITGAVGGSISQASASISRPESSQDTGQTPQTSKTGTSSPERKLVTEPPLSPCIKTRKVVCLSPNAKGTFLPQHYGTMGSFDTLMAELTQRHPDVGRQRIVDALMMMTAQHQGPLCGLPLKTIMEMTSELLTRPASATQL